MIKHYNIILTGKVQHVGLRFLSLKRAYELGIKGFVKYLKEKDKIALEIEGEDENLQLFMRWIRKGGACAEINDIQISEGVFKNYPTFEIIHKTTLRFIQKPNQRRLLNA